MKFSVKKIKADVHHGPIMFEEHVNVGELVQLENNDIRKIEPVHVHGVCFVESDEIVFSYTIEGEMLLPCARTLVDVNYPFRFRTTEVFTTELNKADEEEEIHFIAEDIIDLKPFILETIVLQMPYRVFSDEKVLEDGEGWSFYTEDAFVEEEDKKVDPRLAKLQQLLDNENQE